MKSIFLQLMLDNKFKGKKMEIVKNLYTCKQAISLSFFEIVSHYAVQASLELTYGIYQAGLSSTILLPLPPKHLDLCEQLCLTAVPLLVVFSREILAQHIPEYTHKHVLEKKSKEYCSGLFVPG